MTERTHQIPTGRPQLLHLVLCHYGPNTPCDCSVLVRRLPERELKLYAVMDLVIELDETPRELVDELEQVVTWAQREDGMQ